MEPAVNQGRMVLSGKGEQPFFPEKHRTPARNDNEFHCHADSFFKEQEDSAGQSRASFLIMQLFRFTPAAASPFLYTATSHSRTDTAASSSDSLTGTTRRNCQTVISHRSMQDRLVLRVIFRQWCWSGRTPRVWFNACPRHIGFFRFSFAMRVPFDRILCTPLCYRQRSR